MENALHSVKIMMQSIQDRFPEGQIVVFFSCSTPDNWRTKLYPQYKANRPDRRPEHDAAIREYMLKKYHREIGDNLEADDMIAMWAANSPASTVVCTNDKDMDQIPGVHYDFTKEEQYEIDGQEAEWVIAVQTLAGDSTDNIPGLPGVGIKTAQKMLSEDPNPANHYSKFYDSPEAARYWHLLNEAMVTLPMSTDDMDYMVKEVTDARKAFQAIQEDSS